jgi:hypothetical protein
MTNKKILTTLEAANIGRQMGVRGLIVHRDPADRSLWQVAAPGWLESHEPMTEDQWRRFLTDWIGAGSPAKPVRYNAGDGRKVTVPENDEQDLFDAIREQMSPHAVAAIVAYLQPVRTNNPDVDRQVQWFADQLVELVGGGEAQARLAEELGL